MSSQAHYAFLFAGLERDFGPVSDNTMTGIIGFSGGGPVSMCRVGSGNVFVTCELSLTPEQKRSAQGLKFELMSRLPLSEADTQNFLTSVGSLSLDAKLGDRHTVDVSAVSPTLEIQKIRLRLHLDCEIGGERYGVYEVCDAGAA